jgi:small subunit ribosomal protein S14
MARKAMRHKTTLPPKFEVRRHNRCPLCGRVHAYMRMFDMCRCCFRKFAREGKIPGVVKSSW